MYVISIHNKGGAYKNVLFEGTRIEARVRAKEIRDNNGSRIHFVRYL